MRRLRYVSASSGEIVELDGPITYSGIAASIRAKQWGYDLEGRSISNVRKKAREGELDVTTTWAEADRMSLIFDADVSAQTPGTMECDGWSQRCYVVSGEPEDISAGKARISMVAVLLDGAWRKGESYVMRAASGDSRGTKVYPYVYPYTYSSELGVMYIDVPGVTPAPFRFVFYGPAVSPMVRIGSNLYQYNIAIPTGGHLIVDTLPDAAVTLVDPLGARTNEFACAVRGTGEGCGTYAFERLAPGTQSVSWSDMFGFDLTIWHERGDLPYEPDRPG